MFSPPQPKTNALPRAAQKKVKELRREVLKFSAEKLNRRLSKHLTSFLAVNSSILPPTSIFASLQGLLLKLAQALKSREILSDMRWDDLWDGLNTVRFLTGEMLKDESEICKTVEQIFPVCISVP